MLVTVLRTRGDASADTNAHRIILSVHTASNFINDVLESAITKTLHSAVTSRENLFFSLQRVGNDSRRIFELVNRATNVVAETARKAKVEINDAIRTSLDHLRESMKIIIRNLPESKLSESNLAGIIENGQYRMEAVVENSGQRIVDAIQSYRSHFIKIEKETGHVMVDPESSQEATDAVKNIINAAKSQIQEAVSGSTSFILARIRDCLSHFGDSKVTTVSPDGVTQPANSTETFQVDIITLSRIEDPQEDKLVVVGDVPTTPRSLVTTVETTPTEAPIIVNTPLPNNTLETDMMIAESATVLANETTPKAVSWQDDIPQGSVFNNDTNREVPVDSGVSGGSNSSAVVPSITVSFPVDGTPTPAPLERANLPSTTPSTPLMRRRIPKIKPIVSASSS